MQHDQLRIKRSWLVVLFAFLLFSGWLVSSNMFASTTTDATVGPRAGLNAPTFTLDTLSGESTALADHAGEVIIINMWATWCGPCRAEMPALQTFYDEHRDQGLEILAVNNTVNDGEASVQDFVDEFDLTFPILLDRDGDVTRQYQVRSLPATFVIDRSGVVRSVIFGGPIDKATLEAEVGVLLDEQS